MKGLRLLVLASLVLVVACGSQDSNLYRAPCNPCNTCATGPAVRPSLLDGEIKMTTHWTGATDEVPDVRAIVSEQGRLFCYVETPKGRREGGVSEADWNALWTKLEPMSPWASTQPTVKPNDPTGGPYHLIELRAGNQVSQFSSQHRADILVFTSKDASDRLTYSNVIVDFIAARARTPVEYAAPPPAAPGSQKEARRP
jgi:hypothetical protein